MYAVKNAKLAVIYYASSNLMLRTFQMIIPYLEAFCFAFKFQLHLMIIES
jgi:hypothetical protein